MSRWAADSHLETILVSPGSCGKRGYQDRFLAFSASAGAEEGVAPNSLSASESSKLGGPVQRPGKANSSSHGWMKVLFPVLSALFFLSALFSVFAPAPLLILFFRHGRKWGWLGTLASGLLVGLLGGSFSLVIYTSFVFPVVLIMAELLKRKRSLERAATITLLSIGLMGGAIGLGYSKVHHINPWSAVTQEFSQGIDQVIQSIQESGKQPWVDSGEAEEWKKDLLIEMPSAVAILALIMVWANLMILLRVNPGQIRESLGLDYGFFRKWKAPEFLVWPTIVSGFFLLVEVRYVSVVAINLFKFLMAIYAIQGLSVLSYFFQAWNIRRFYRGAGFMVVTLLMRPLLLALGFFDLWFDFRSKIRQS